MSGTRRQGPTAMSPKIPREGSVTAKELVERLRSDPEYQRQVEWQERKRQRLREERSRDAAPVIAELVQNGFPVTSLDELLSGSINYQNAIPLLMKWLPKVSNSRVKESLVRCLAVEEAKPRAAQLLVDEFRKARGPSDDSLRWAIGNTLSVIADDSVFEDVVALLRNPEFGTSREMLAIALGNMSDERATDVLIELLGDPDVAGHAVVGLGKLKAKEARPKIEPFLEHPKAWVRKEAKKALAKIDRT